VLPPIIWGELRKCALHKHKQVADILIASTALERSGIFDYAIVPWLLAGAMLATGFGAECFIALPST
jgi:hypothetical protein